MILNAETETGAEPRLPFYKTLTDLLPRISLRMRLKRLRRYRAKRRDERLERRRLAEMENQRVREKMFSGMRDVAQMLAIRNFVDRLGDSVDLHREHYQRLYLNRPKRYGVPQVGVRCIEGSPFVLSVFCWTEGTGAPTTLAQATFDFRAYGREIVVTYPALRLVLTYDRRAERDALDNLHAYVAALPEHNPALLSAS